MVQAMDTQIGHVLDALEQSGLAQNTIVVFTSDNGGERYSDTWPFTGIKGELLEGGLRVPAVLRWPEQVKAGQETAQPVITMDWLPTFLAAAGGVPDPAFASDGINILPFWLIRRGRRIGLFSGVTNCATSMPTFWGNTSI